jgi:hypothetical protein
MLARRRRGNRRNQRIVNFEHINNSNNSNNNNNNNNKSCCPLFGLTIDTVEACVLGMRMARKSTLLYQDQDHNQETADLVPTVCDGAEKQAFLGGDTTVHSRYDTGVLDCSFVSKKWESSLHTNCDGWIALPHIPISDHRTRAKDLSTGPPSDLALVWVYVLFVVLSSPFLFYKRTAQVSRMEPVFSAYSIIQQRCLWRLHRLRSVPRLD